MDCLKSSSGLRLLTATMAALIAALPAAAAGKQTDAVIFQPHRAVYDLSLARTAPGSSVSSVTGRIVYELMGNACEGYAQTMRFVTEITNTSGQTEVSDLRTSSWEDVPATRLRFNSTTYGSERLTDQTQGVANKPKGSRSGIAVELTKPKKDNLKLSGDMYFPIEHSMEVIRHARAGQLMFTANIYDGAEGGGTYYATSSAIGKLERAGPARQLANVKAADQLAAVRVWPIAIAYFDPVAKRIDSPPLYEMSFRFHENGVTSELVIDNGDYALKGVLDDLVMLDANPCP